MSVETSPFTPAEAKLAQLVVEDTIWSAYTDKDLLKAATVEDVLDLLGTEEGNQAMLEIMAGYLGLRIPALALGVESKPVDPRLASEIDVRRMSISFPGLKKAIVEELISFLDLSEEREQAKVEEIIREREGWTPIEGLTPSIKREE